MNNNYHLKLGARFWFWCCSHTGQCWASYTLIFYKNTFEISLKHLFKIRLENHANFMVPSLQNSHNVVTTSMLNWFLYFFAKKCVMGGSCSQAYLSFSSSVLMLLFSIAKSETNLDGWLPCSGIAFFLQKNSLTNRPLFSIGTLCSVGFYKSHKNLSELFEEEEHLFMYLPMSTLLFVSG